MLPMAKTAARRTIGTGSAVAARIARSAALAAGPRVASDRAVAGPGAGVSGGAGASGAGPAGEVARPPMRGRMVVAVRRRCVMAGLLVSRRRPVRREAVVSGGRVVLAVGRVSAAIGVAIVPVAMA